MTCGSAVCCDLSISRYKTDHKILEARRTLIYDVVWSGRRNLEVEGVLIASWGDTISTSLPLRDTQTRSFLVNLKRHIL